MAYRERSTTMKRVFLILSIAALALPGNTLAKGPSAASMSGPGDGGGITFTGGGESGGTPLGDLTQLAGFFPASFGQEPDPMLAGRPTGDLGPRYTITYSVPGPNNQLDKLHQDIYPYAPNGPVTYMKPGQKFFGTEQTRGGWYQADPQLKEILVSAGLPARASAASSDTFSFSTGLVSLLAVALLLAAATAAVVLRRRARPAAA
jgi:hypothetical protein